MQHLSDSEIVKAIVNFCGVVGDLPDAMKYCDVKKQEHVAAIEDWAEIFNDSAGLPAKVAQSMRSHKPEVDNDVSAITTDWSNGDYMSAGHDLASLFTLLFGPIHVPGENAHPRTAPAD